MSREASWADMATAVMAHLDAYGADAIYDVWHVLNAYTVTATTPACADCRETTEPERLAEPTPGLSPHMRAVLDVLGDGRPRTPTEIRPDAPHTAARSLRALDRRGLVASAGDLWWRR